MRLLNTQGNINGGAKTFFTNSSSRNKLFYSCLSQTVCPYLHGYLHPTDVNVGDVGSGRTAAVQLQVVNIIYLTNSYVIKTITSYA